MTRTFAGSKRPTRRYTNKATTAYSYRRATMGSTRLRAKAPRRAGAQSEILSMTRDALSLITQSHHGIDPHGAAGGDVACDESDANKRRDSEHNRPGISRLHAKQKLLNEARDPDGAEQPRTDSSSKNNQHVAQNQAKNRTSLRAKGHADTDFMRSLRDNVGDDSIEADGGEQERQAAEEAGKVGH